MHGQMSFVTALALVIALLIAAGAYISLCLGLGFLMNKLPSILQRRLFLRPSRSRLIMVWFIAQTIFGLAWIVHTASSRSGGQIEVLIGVFAILAFVCVTGIFGAVAFSFAAF